ncbi:MAG: hypothetical protein ACTSPF_10135 [Candidatus Heimdallarchaeaceae archaeon]
MSNSTNEESIFDEEESELLWKKIIEKIKPYITHEDIVNMDLESFSALINRLYAIKEITEQEQSYAKKNRDLILIRMGLLHNIPDLSESDLELALKQISVLASNVTVSLNPEEEIIKLREKLSIISRVTLDNAKDIATLLTKTKDSLMNIGISGSVFYEIEKLCQMLKRQKEEDLPTKNDIIEASFEWQLKIQK